MLPVTDCSGQSSVNGVLAHYLFWFPKEPLGRGSSLGTGCILLDIVNKTINHSLFFLFNSAQNPKQSCQTPSVNLFRPL